MSDPPLIYGPHLLGAIPSPVDPRDYQLADRLDTATPQPVRYVATLVPPVLNQGNTGRCVAFATTGKREWEARRREPAFPNLDAQWLYMQAGGTPDEQGGLIIRNALGVLLHQGEPLVGDASTAARYRITAYYAVPIDVASMKAALVQFGPLLIGSDWYNSWFHPRKGILPAPTGGIVGGHARYIIGWDDHVNGGSFLVRNSWGKNWPGSVNGSTYDHYGWLLAAMHDCWRFF